MEKSTVDHQREDKHSNSTRSAHGRNLAHNSFMSLKLKYFGHIKHKNGFHRTLKERMVPGRKGTQYWLKHVDYLFFIVVFWFSR